MTIREGLVIAWISLTNVSGKGADRACIIFPSRLEWLRLIVCVFGVYLIYAIERIVQRRKRKRVCAILKLEVVVSAVVNSEEWIILIVLERVAGFFRMHGALNGCTTAPASDA